MTFMNLLRSGLALLAAWQAGCTHAADGAVPPDSAAVVFGIRLGEPLSSQFAPCPLDDGVPRRLPEQACWTVEHVRRNIHSVKLPARLMAALGRIDIRSVREVGGVVVEVEAEFPPSDVKRVERHLRQRLGPPASSEAFERDSRVFGVSTFMAHSWHGAGATLHFSERASGDTGQVRAFVDSWAVQHEREEKAWRDRYSSGR